MKKSRIFFVLRSVAVLALASASVAATMLGGFQLRVDVPEAGSDAVLLVRTYRCHQPEKAKVSGTAEGIVRGKRVSLPIELQAVAKGVYAVERQWPSVGAWVLAFSGSYDGQHTSTVVSLDDRGDVALRETERGTEWDVRTLPRKLSSRDVARALERMSMP